MGLNKGTCIIREINTVNNTTAIAICDVKYSDDVAYPSFEVTLNLSATQGNINNQLQDAAMALINGDSSAGPGTIEGRNDVRLFGACQV